MATEVDVDAEVQSLLLEKQVREFLYREAALLDARKLEEWLSLMDENVTYRAPLRITDEHSGPSYSDSAYHFNDDYESLQVRVGRFDSEYAWSERPPSSTQRFVTNIRANRTDEGDIKATSKVLLYYSQGHSAEYTLLFARREDLLVPSNDGFSIRERDVYFAHGVPKIDKISVFL